MKLRLSVSVALCAVGAPIGAGAHHADAPHFVTDRTIELSATVQSWQAINPHGVLMLTVNDEAGRPQTWRCETNAVVIIARAGVDRSSFKPGDKVQVKAAPGRRNPRLCAVREVRFADGRVVNLRAQAAIAQGQRPTPRRNTSIYGVWEPETRVISAGATPADQAQLANRSPMLDQLTPAGRRAVAAYDPIRDDPARKCSPISQQRLWNAVGSPFSIARDGEKVILRHEFMDAARIVHLDRKDHAKAGPRTTLGHSIGRFEGDTLVVETANFAPGVVQQYALDAAGTLRGVPRSDAYRMTERIRFEPSTGRLEVSFGGIDPKFYTAAFPQQTRTYQAAAEAGFDRFNCRPDPERAARRG